MVNSTDVQTILDADLLCLIRKYRITKVRSRQAVKLPAVQPIVMLTRHWRGKVGEQLLYEHVLF